MSPCLASFLASSLPPPFFLPQWRTLSIFQPAARGRLGSVHFFNELVLLLSKQNIYFFWPRVNIQYQCNLIEPAGNNTDKMQTANARWQMLCLRFSQTGKSAIYYQKIWHEYFFHQRRMFLKNVMVSYNIYLTIQSPLLIC